ncbi:MAG: response regulator transcription factor [Akkermansiaceae bacterium]|jgi:DNA-binding NarL/FixJ family response regulator|nr:response regulator transcription factor [Akkermansiaceae bacterium]MDP4645516.1 response regulator transcription factor [Akkermansiaceae bacterium]MDP4719859.1 response regulator transcription factor [Akkermansiaceae bacterium]MDP4778677.1 response regulator transcription factor [Akkermansiaceae bacterium]MDP4848269.1 response regulator transcription factor [Akkermansiaceae bacterium]
MSATKEISKIWIVEDHQTFAKNIRRLIEGEDNLECPYHFSSPEELFDKLKFTQDKPDIMLLDLGLPGMNGLEVLVRMRKMMPELKVLILSAFDDRERVYRAICNGASGYLLKTADPDEIIEGINDVIHGAAALSGAIATMILNGFSKHGPVEELEALTSREEDVLKSLVKGYTKKEIGEELDISQHTVDMHLRSIYRKLHVRTQTEAVSKALRQGIV